MASPIDVGTQMIGQLVDLVVSLVKDWYPGLIHSKTSLEQKIPCYECVKMGRRVPFMFSVEQCLEDIQKNKTTAECEYDRNNPEINHSIPMDEVIPDLLLKDIHTESLNQSEIKCEEILTRRLVGYEKICRGTYYGRLVSIKYLAKNKGAFNKLRSEVQVLKNSNHPCLVCLIGIIMHPNLALVIEEAPRGSLEIPLVREQIPIHRITLFRIATQVAAALNFLHKTGVLFRDLKASNVLLWTLEHNSLCHCKLASCEAATHFFPTGARGLLGTKGFIAPEVLYKGTRAQPSLYNERADIFSFSMLLYQIITRQYPYHTLKPNRIDTAVQRGERPKLPEDCCTSTAYHYLTQLMQMCWDGNPHNRPTTENIIRYLCLDYVQSVMSVLPVKANAKMRQAYAILPTATQASSARNMSSEAWILSDGKEGIEIDIYSVNRLQKVKSQLIKQNKFCSMCKCKNFLWICSRASYDALNVFNVETQKLVHKIPQEEHVATCITCSDSHIYVGTQNGYCLSYSSEIKQMKQKYKKIYVSDHPITGILFVPDATGAFVWVSHTRYIYFLRPDNLAHSGRLYSGQTDDDYIGQLSISSSNEATVWSAHLGGRMLSAWDVAHRSNKFDINTADYIDKVSPSVDDKHKVIAVMTPVLDTVWVGMKSGHILVFADEHLLTWYHPFTTSVQFITAIPCTGPCKKEECMVVTGAEKFSCPLPEEFRKINHPSNANGVIILWEAFNAQLLKQVKLVSEKGPSMFNSHKSLQAILQKEELGFIDGTHISTKDSFIVRLLQEENTTLNVTCSKPVKLYDLLHELKKERGYSDIPKSAFIIEYQDSDSNDHVWIKSQEDLDLYVTLHNRPQLLLSFI